MHDLNVPDTDPLTVIKEKDCVLDNHYLLAAREPTTFGEMTIPVILVG